MASKNKHFRTIFRKTDNLITQSEAKDNLHSSFWVRVDRKVGQLEGVMKIYRNLSTCSVSSGKVKCTKPNWKSVGEYRVRLGKHSRPHDISGVTPHLAWYMVERIEKRRHPKTRKKLHMARIYPLYEEDITRKECQRIIQRAGLPVPFKSGCFFCPGQSLDSWKRLYYEHPDLYEAAARLEENAGHKHKKHATLDPHGITLREHAKRRWKGQMQMDLSQWMPCLCTL